jgi:imidazolonepropionase
MEEVGLKQFVENSAGLVADLVVKSCFLATMEGPQKARDQNEANDCGLESGWTVAVKGDKILWVGPDPDWRGKTGKMLNAHRKLVTPGYVDSHTHLVYGGDRASELRQKLQGKSYMDILAAGGGIMRTVRDTREASDNGLEESALRRLQFMAQNGTTTVEAKSGYGLDTETELRMLAVHPRLFKRTGLPMVSTFLGAHAVPDDFKGRTDAYVDLVIDEMIPKVKEQAIARFCDVFVEEGVFTFEQGERILMAAKKAGFELRMHADEIVNTKGAELAAKVGCVSADHLLKISDEGVKAISDAGTVATLMPTVPLTMMKPQWSPAAKLLEALVPVALATDHNPNNPVTDMTLVGQLGCYTMGLTPSQAMTAVTWNGACALGVEDKVGSLEPGKKANLLIHDAKNLDDWVYQFGHSTVRTVILNGKVVPRS